MVATKNRDRNESNGFLCLGLSSLCVAGRGFAYIGVGGGTNSKDSKTLVFSFCKSHYFHNDQKMGESLPIF
jgi:hypothetical protein